MARRDFRQFGLADSIVRRRSKKSEWLDRLDAALDWPALETIVADIDASREGGLAYPLLTYVKLLLLQQWYGLSDEGLEAAVDDRLSFRRFAGIPLSESVPDPSSVWRFREQLARRGLAERLLAEVNRQLDAKGLVLRRGTLIDATILDAAVRPPGGDAGGGAGGRGLFAGPRRNRPLKPWQVASNKAVAPVRAGVERLFATMKRAYGYRRVRHLGLARNDVQLQTLCVAINLRRALALGLAWGAECVRCRRGRTRRRSGRGVETGRRTGHRPEP